MELQVGEWSLDKRHYMGGGPPRQLLAPPACAHDRAHVLRSLYNNASGTIPSWGGNGGQSDRFAHLEFRDVDLRANRGACPHSREHVPAAARLQLHRVLLDCSMLLQAILFLPCGGIADEAVTGRPQQRRVRFAEHGVEVVALERLAARRAADHACIGARAARAAAAAKRRPTAKTAQQQSLLDKLKGFGAKKPARARSKPKPKPKPSAPPAAAAPSRAAALNVAAAQRRQREADIEQIVAMGFARSAAGAALAAAGGRAERCCRKPAF